RYRRGRSCSSSRWQWPRSFWFGATEPPPLLRRHPDRAVETNHLAVEHRVADDLTHERRELRGPPETRRKRHRLAERFGDFRRYLAHHRRLEDARRDRHDADSVARQLARDRQRHSDETRLRRAVRGLPDLSVERGDRRAEHDDAALALRVGRAFG